MKRKAVATELAQLLECFGEPPCAMAKLAADIGAEDAIRVMEHLGGQKKHIPTVAAFVADLKRQVRDEEICTKFKGDYDELAAEYRLTPRQIRYIVNGRPSRAKKMNPVGRNVTQSRTC